MGHNYSGPIIELGIEAKREADDIRLVRALAQIVKEDTTSRVRKDSRSGKTVISGTGEGHLGSIVDRIRSEFQIEVNVSPPRTAYKEIVRKRVLEEGKFIRKNGAQRGPFEGRNQYGHCFLLIEPLPMGKGIEFVNEAKPDRIPPKFVPAVEKGVRDAIDGGGRSGYPFTDMRVTLVDGSYNEAESNDMAFHVAGAMALLSGCIKADPSIIEPIMKFEVETPEYYAGDVIGDLNSRRAKIEEMGDRGELKFVRGTVPLSEMFGYAAAVSSLTRGRAIFSMTASHFEEAPANIVKRSIDPHSGDEPPAASAGRPVRPIRPRPGLSGDGKRPFPPEE